MGVEFLCGMDWAAWEDLVGLSSYVAGICCLGIGTSFGMGWRWLFCISWCGVLLFWGSIISSFVAGMPPYVAGVLGRHDLLSWDWDLVRNGVVIVLYLSAWNLVELGWRDFSGQPLWCILILE